MKATDLTPEVKLFVQECVHKAMKEGEDYGYMVATSDVHEILLTMGRDGEMNHTQIKKIMDEMTKMREIKLIAGVTISVQD